MLVSKQQALDYHNGSRPGKIEVTPTKPCRTQRDLSLAYTPGVAEPCLEIQKNPQDAFKYTARGNLVAVLSNGTAVLGLGDIGALAGKPVMEGQGGVCSNALPMSTSSISRSTATILKRSSSCASYWSLPSAASISRTSRLPTAFTSKRHCASTMKIPVFHDDQHGTAIISGAALLNASGGCRERYPQDEGRLQRRRSGGNRLCRALRAPRRQDAKTSFCAIPRALSTKDAATA